MFVYNIYAKYRGNGCEIKVGMTESKECVNFEQYPYLIHRQCLLYTQVAIHLNQVQNPQ